MLKKLREKLRALFTSKDEQKLIAAESDFDKLMKKVDDDELDLAKLENHVREEFDEIGGDVEKKSAVGVK